MSYPLPPPIRIPLTTLPSHDCHYLPGRMATTRAFRVERMPGILYDRFMNAGFRRSGQIVYQPVCGHCRECVPIRVRVSEFRPGKSQRRCARRNADLTVTADVPQLTDEKMHLYRRYLAQWHTQPASESIDRDSIESFLYNSPVHSLEFTYRNPRGDLLGVGIVDVTEQILSSVYFYFDPAESTRGLGTFGALYEMAWAMQHNIEFYYLGYLVRDCDNMNYKSRFKPAEILDGQGAWKPLELPYVRME